MTNHYLILKDKNNVHNFDVVSFKESIVVCADVAENAFKNYNRHYWYLDILLPLKPDSQWVDNVKCGLSKVIRIGFQLSDGGEYVNYMDINVDSPIRFSGFKSKCVNPFDRYDNPKMRIVGEFVLNYRGNYTW